MNPVRKEGWWWLDRPAKPVNWHRRPSFASPYVPAVILVSFNCNYIFFPSLNQLDSTLLVRMTYFTRVGLNAHLSATAWKLPYRCLLWCLAPGHRWEIIWILWATTLGVRGSDSFRLRSGEFGGQVGTSSSSPYSWAHSRMFFFLWCDWAYCRRWGRWQCLHRMLLSWGNVLWSICTSARIQGFPAEHCILMRWSVLFTSPVCGFNAGADKCKSACSPCIDWGINKEL